MRGSLNTFSLSLSFSFSIRRQTAENEIESESENVSKRAKRAKGYHHQKGGLLSSGLSKNPYGIGSAGKSKSFAAASVTPEFQSGGVTPSSERTKKSLRLRVPSGPVAPWPPLGTTSSSKSLPARIKASTTCMVDDGSTLVSISPTARNSLPFRFFACVTFELAS